jgi:hypothetical protein
VRCSKSFEVGCSKSWSEVFKSLEGRGSEVLKWMFTVFEVECSKSLKWDVQRALKLGVQGWG